MRARMELIDNKTGEEKIKKSLLDSAFRFQQFGGEKLWD